ncbi:hypothetical protein PVAND_003721 [Polypedilum vanderplanki]|uniref:Phosphatidylinositol N-acetylglucosaminyltransferase subunit H conserved domain-containing protein n=1 Tax=Polypedilum vanderplanki TaxID=319348 RepID=A0A9J6BVF4_POLVA|nr:hypothetical protein PVAND_003721 [Polypedilum vanderplanki]
MTKTSSIITNYESSRYLHLTVKNNEFRRKSITFASILSFLFIVYAIVFSQIQNYSIHIVFFIIILLLIYLLTNLVKSENLQIVKGIGVFHVKHSLLSSKSFFIPYENISDIIVNEVICFNRIRFVVQILCKRSLFNNNLQANNLVINGNFCYSLQS